MSVIVVTGAASGMGRCCVERLRGTSEHLLAVDLEKPAIEGTVGVACDVSEGMVEPGSAAVCFSSLAATQIAPFADPALDALLDEPLAEGFLDEITAQIGDSGFAYALAKRGVVRSCARASVRWGHKGGRVNSIAPGIIDTPMGRQELEQQPAMRDMLAQVPLGRLGDADEVAVVAAFLLSDDASFVSGVDLLVDGAIVPGMAAAAQGK